MKKILFLTIGICAGISVFAQFDAMMRKQAGVVAPVPTVSYNIDLPVVGAQIHNNTIATAKSVSTDPVTATTRYDLQTNNTNQKRVYMFPDKTIGAVCTWSAQDASWTDRGSGYNYFDGTTWQPEPTARVENIRVGWGEYRPWGATGELIIAHESTGPLVMSTRTVKGTGAWTTTPLPALPPTITALAWPRTVTNGPNHTYIHVIALTLPTANGGQLYGGMDGALLYSKSMDGGTTWTAWTQLPGMTSTDYNNFSADVYSWAEPHGDTLAFTSGNSWRDQFLMKSVDNGSTWTKTVIHHSLYNQNGTSTSFFYCPDGTMAVALDNQGMAHVVFGLQSDSGTYPTASYYRPYTEGVIYWNEHMPTLRQDLNPDSLNATGNYVGWVKDTNVFHPPTGVTLAAYYTSLTSNPELVIDEFNKVFLLWAGATLLVDPNNYTLRHLFGRDGVITPAGNILWHNDTLVDITGDFVQYNFAECMYPSASPTSDANVDILFQKDDYGGSYVKGLNISGYAGQTAADDNSITMIQWTKPIWAGITEKQQKPAMSVSQNFPNPVSGITTVNVYMQNPGDLNLKVTDLTGQIILRQQKSNVLAGMSQFVIDGTLLSPGVYFYSVTQGSTEITKKMIVQ